MAKMKGKKAVRFLEHLKQIDNCVEFEKTFDWLFISKKDEISENEQNILEALWKDCENNKKIFKSKKRDCICEDIYSNDERIKGISRKLEFDFYLPKYNIAIEFDESQHFTHERGVTYNAYPKIDFNYDIERWKELCLMKKNDPEPPCRDWKRAYRDAVRDLKARENSVILLRVYVKDYDAEAFKDENTYKKLRELIETEYIK